MQNADEAKVAEAKVAIVDGKEFQRVVAEKLAARQQEVMLGDSVEGGAMMQRLSTGVDTQLKKMGLNRSQRRKAIHNMTHKKNKPRR